MDEDSRSRLPALSLSGSIWSTDRTESADDDAEITTYADKYYTDERGAQSLSSGNSELEMMLTQPRREIRAEDAFAYIFSSFLPPDGRVHSLRRRAR